MSEEVTSGSVSMTGVDRVSPLLFTLGRPTTVVPLFGELRVVLSSDPEVRVFPVSHPRSTEDP